MSITNKVLGQSAPDAGDLTPLYAVLVDVSAVCSTLSVCNTGGATTFRVAVRPENAAIDRKHYIAYDSTLGDHEAVFLTLGITLAETDVVYVGSESGLVAFGLFGAEVG